MNPIQALIDAAEEWLKMASTPTEDVPEEWVESLENRFRLAIPAARAYAERMGECVEAAWVLNRSDTAETWDGLRDALNALASLDAPTDSGTAEVGPDAGGGATSPDVIREAKCEAWEEGYTEGFDAADNIRPFRPNPYAQTQPPNVSKEI